MKLNEEQSKVIKHKNTPLMVLAGPGSGKTTVIINKIKHIIKEEKILAHKILAITFTKNAATEMKDRFKSQCVSKIDFLTFHSLFFKVLKRERMYNNTNLILEYDRIKLVKKIIKKMELEYDDEKRYINEILTLISNIKNNLIDISNFNPINFPKDVFIDIYNSYEEIKRQYSKIDFDDILIETYHLLKNDEEVLNYWKKRYKYILVDEFQDINKVQYEVIKMLANENIIVVGDDDQSIYKFRGAKPEMLFKFVDDFKNAKIIKLENNYRSNEEIVSISNKLIKNNTNRYDKNIINIKDSEGITEIIKTKNAIDEAKKIVKIIEKNNYLEDCAIIYRTNNQATSIIDSFLDKNIKFNVKDGVSNIYNHFVFKDILSYLKLVNDREDVESFKKIINKPTRYISKALLSRIKKGNVFNQIYNMKSIKKWQLNRIEELEYNLDLMKNKNIKEQIKFIRKTIDYNKYIIQYADYKKISPEGLKEVLEEVNEKIKYFDNLNDIYKHVESFNEIKKKKNYGGVTLSTMHGVKGLEFRTVFIIGCNEGILPHEKAMDEIEEERRLFYVAITRAKENLYFTYTKKRYEKDVEKSRFISEIKDGEFAKGDRIIHNKFGEGIIKKIKTGLLHVKFDKLLINKKISKKHCLENNLIERLD